jgi:hypothetical protein
MSRLWSLLLFAGMMAPGAVAQKSTPSKAPAAAKSQPKLSDAQIEAAIRAKLSASKIGADHFSVHVQGGVATLEGKTDVVQHKGTATRLAKTGGASAVNNRIQVSEAGKKRAADNLEKGRRRAQISRGEARSQTSAAKK